MGCLKKIFINILILALIIAFFYFGGWGLLRNLYSDFKNPPREVAIQNAKFFGDFNNVSSDYKIGRTLGLFGYKKLTVLNVPSSQKTDFLAIGTGKLPTLDDFKEQTAHKFLEEKFSNSSFDFVKAFEIHNVQYSQLKSKNVYYMTFTLLNDKVPFFNKNAFLGVYEKQDKNGDLKTYYISSLKGIDKFSSKIVLDILNGVIF